MSSWQPPSIGSRPVALLGAGVLGRRIACTFVAGGYNVHIRDPSSEARRDALQYIEEHKQEYADNISSSTTTTKSKLGSYSASEDIESAVKDAWLVIEAVPEKLQLKIDTMAELDRKASADCIFGSNSSSFKSSLMLDKVSPARRRLICNVHYTMPPAIRTVELMTDGETEPGVFPFLTDVLNNCGMLPATARKESTGFIFNRLWAAVKRETLMILAEGVSDASEIDKLWQHMFQAKVTPCRLMDQIGLDTVAFIEDNYIQERHLDGSLTVNWLRANYLAQGKLGKKTSDEGGLYPPTTTQSAWEHSGSTTPTPRATETQPPLFFLDVGLGGNLTNLSKVSTNGKILRRDPSGTITTLIRNQPAPDGIAVCASTNRLFWTNMGAHPSARDGSLMSSALDGTDIQTVLAPGQVHTPKQLVLVPTPHRPKLYFCDREGMSVHRCDAADGSHHETLVQRAGAVGDQTQWCVGIAVDPVAAKIYWTQKGHSKAGQGRIFRAGMEVPQGETAATRSDIETLFDGLPEPIDLEIESGSEVLYWTDRGEHPRGSSLNAAYVGGGGGGEKGVRIIARHFHEPIGLQLDVGRGRAYVTDLGGSVYEVDLQSGGKTVLCADEGCYTGIAALWA
ncbi:hypothetical protein B0T22DRAFT_456057 [Podospora appendiculata]|uniref:3-hydroxyacyl-CoA dehydrogenase n=1 Tax=Podospora appendiculata TaxID=314037 RepID=A0AAE1CIM0_9PEZI|nr:hypothetical protein B0T22DRAFT_456057 [Podospora appendiculata]